VVDYIEMKTDTKLNSSPMKNWMSDLGEKISNINIFDLIIPGTHNSGSYSITSTSDYSHDAPPFITSIPLAFSALLKPLSSSWSVCQHKTIFEQLQSGIRYLDLRICYNDDTLNYHVCHGLFGCEIDSILFDIKTFITENTKEILFISFSHVHNFTNERHVEFIDKVIEILCRQKLIEDNLKLGSIWEKGQQVVVGYPAEFSPSCFWGTYAQFNTFWPNVANPSLLIPSLTDTLSTMRRDRSFPFVLQGIVTPDTNCIVGGFFNPLAPRNLFDLVSGSSREVVKFLKSTKKDSQISNINIVTVDFFHITDFVETLVQMNCKL